MTRSRTILLLPALAAACTLTACGANEPGSPNESDAPTTSAPAPVTPASTPAPSPSTSSSPSPSGSAGSTVPDDQAELDVQDQNGDGRSVAVQEVRITAAAGFVAIYRGDQLLGSAAIGSNSRSASVQLDSPITRSGEYQAVLFGDEGNGSFDPQTDPKLVDAGDGDVVDEDFTYTVG